MGSIRMPEPDKIMKLMVEATKQMEQAYAPYSQYTVGAALLDSEGNIFSGCNIENASYPAGICAERVAISKAISEGSREFEAIAIAGGLRGDISKACPPCGICRQVLSELCPPDMPVILVKSDGYECHALSELLPFSFML